MYQKILNKINLFFNGRISRKKFNYNLLLLIILSYVLSYIIDYIDLLESNYYENILKIFIHTSDILIIFLLIRNFVFLIKRLHDINKSGMYLIYIPIGTFLFIVLIGVIYSFFGRFFGNSIAGMQLSIAASPITLFVILLSYIFLMFKKGTEGSNKYGDPPKY